MGALEQPKRRELVFTASPESWERIDRVMALQGHDKYSLTVARGFALVQWVLEQQAEGRIIGAMACDSDDFEPLEERPELLAPRPRMQVVPAQQPMADPAPVVAAPPVEEPAELASVEEAVSPLAALKRLETTAARKKEAQADSNEPPKGPTNAPLTKPKKFIVPRRKVAVDNRPTGAGRSPIRTLEAERSECLARGEKYPIAFGGKPLPADLDHSCLQYLVDGMKVPEASHFRIMGPSHIGIYAHLPKKDWCVYDPIFRKWRPDREAREGFMKLYSIELAVEYLQRQPAPEAVPEDMEEVTY